MVRIGPIEVTNNAVEGLLGFVSLRSVSYGLKYLECSMNLGIVSDTWVRVIGDTFGKLQNGDETLPYRTRIDSARKRWIINYNDSGYPLRGIPEVVAELNTCQSDSDAEPLIAELRKLCTPIDQVSTKDLAEIIRGGGYCRKAWETFAKEISDAN